MKKRFFITGADSDTDQTSLTVGLLAAAARAGARSLGLKPIATGANLINGALRNRAALLIQEASSVNLPYEQTNPIVFELAVEPYVAAMKSNRLVTVSRLEGFIKGALLTPHEFTLVEGISGWRAPLNDREFLSDVAKALGFPVILVVNIEPGGLNHAILTAETIVRDGLILAGWVVNIGQEKMPFYEDSVSSLASLLSAPLLGVLPFKADENDFDKLFFSL
ncbi:MAG: dethiobiotin synthase [Marinomonas colpomeniae]